MLFRSQAFLRNKGNAAQLLAAVRRLDGVGAVDAYGALVGTGLPPKFASAVTYFLAGEQEGGSGSELKPVIICSNRAKVAGLASEGDWTADEYGEYLAALASARDAYDASLPLDAVEWALREFARHSE